MRAALRSFEVSLPAGPKEAGLLRSARVRIYAASFLVDAATYSFSVALSCHAESRLGKGYWELGKLGAITAFSYSLMCLLTGGLSDRVGSLPLAFASLGLIAATQVGTLFAATFDHLLLAGAAMGISLSLFWPPILRQLSLLSPGSKLWSTLGVFNILWAMGVALGTAATPAVYAAWDLGRTLTLGLGVALAAAAVLAARMPAPLAPRDRVPQLGEAVPPERARLFLSLAWIANFTAFFALVGLVRIFPRISSDLGIPLERMGWILFPLDLGKIAAFCVLTWCPFWHYSFAWLAAAQGAAGIALVAAGLAEAWGLFVILFPVLGALSGLTYFSSIYYGLNLREGEGKKSAIHETILSSGVCFGPLLCGLVGEKFTSRPGAAIVFGGLVVLGGLSLQLLWYRNGSRRTIP